MVNNKPFVNFQKLEAEATSMVEVGSRIDNIASVWFSSLQRHLLYPGSLSL